MIMSMTGFGRAKTVVDEYEFVVEIKSVNSRFADYVCKMPKQFNRLEDRIKALISEYATRGKIELYISVEKNSDCEDDTIVLNEGYLKGYLKCLVSLRDEYGLKNDISVMSVASQKEIFTYKRPEEESVDELWDRLKQALTPAFEEFFKLKCIEGKRLSDDILEKLKFFDGFIDAVKARSPQIVENHRAKLSARIEEMTGGIPLDESRLIQEVALLADKVSVDEEIVRLSSHIESFREILTNAVNSEAIVPVGRKLDFLLQEINREINTTGSKANDIELAKLVVDAKSEAEKIREQIQNFE